MKRIIALVLTVVLACGMSVVFTGCGKKSDENEHTGFYVDGTKLYDANGKEFIMRGINVPHGWYKSFTTDSLKRCAEFGCNTVRVVLGEGSQYDEDLDTDVARIIEQCKSLNMIAVLEVHDFTGTNNPDDIERAVKYWLKIKDVLIGNEEYVIINIANEWWGDWTSEGWKDGYISAITQLREAGLTHTLMVDCAGYAQYPKSLFAYAKDVLASDTIGNTMFSIHMYDNAGGNDKVVKKNIDKTLALGVCLCIGEFSCEHKGNPVAEEYIMDYCTDMGVGYIAWSYAGNGSGLQPLDVTIPWKGELTEWGDELVNGPNGIKETSVICSVFDTDNDSNTSNKNQYTYVTSAVTTATTKATTATTAE